MVWPWEMTRLSDKSLRIPVFLSPLRAGHYYVQVHVRGDVATIPYNAPSEDLDIASPDVYALLPALLLAARIEPLTHLTSSFFSLCWGVHDFKHAWRSSMCCCHRSIIATGLVLTCSQEQAAAFEAAQAEAEHAAAEDLGDADMPSSVVEPFSEIAIIRSSDPTPAGFRRQQLHELGSFGAGVAGGDVGVHLCMSLNPTLAHIAHVTTCTAPPNAPPQPPAGYEAVPVNLAALITGDSGAAPVYLAVKRVEAEAEQTPPLLDVALSAFAAAELPGGYVSKLGAWALVLPWCRVVCDIEWGYVTWSARTFRHHLCTHPANRLTFTVPPPLCFVLCCAVLCCAVLCCAGFFFSFLLSDTTPPK